MAEHAPEVATVSTEPQFMEVVTNTRVSNVDSEHGAIVDPDSVLELRLGWALLVRTMMQLQVRPWLRGRGPSALLRRYSTRSRICCLRRKAACAIFKNNQARVTRPGDLAEASRTEYDAPASTLVGSDDLQGEMRVGMQRGVNYCRNVEERGTVYEELPHCVRHCISTQGHVKENRQPLACNCAMCQIPPSCDALWLYLPPLSFRAMLLLEIDSPDLTDMSAPSVNDTIAFFKRPSSPYFWLHH